MGLSSSKDKEDFNPQGLQYIPISDMYKYEDVFEFENIELFEGDRIYDRIYCKTWICI